MRLEMAARFFAAASDVEAFGPAWLLPALIPGRECNVALSIIVQRAVFRSKAPETH